MAVDNLTSVGDVVDLPAETANGDGAILEICRNDIPPSLVVVFTEAHPKEIQAFKAESVLKVGMYNPNDKTIIFIFNFGNEFKVEAPFNIKRISEDKQDFYELQTETSRLFLICTLLDREQGATRGTVRNYRGVTWSPRFTQLAVNAIKKQNKHTRAEVEFANNQAIGFNSVDDMAKKIDFHKCGEE